MEEKDQMIKEYLVKRNKSKENREKVSKTCKEKRIKNLLKKRTCIHCSRTSDVINFAKKKRVRKSGTVMQIQNICITCQREINKEKSLRHYYNNKETINQKRKIKWHGRVRSVRKKKKMA